MYIQIIEWIFLKIFWKKKKKDNDDEENRKVDGDENPIVCELRREDEKGLVKRQSSSIIQSSPFPMLRSRVNYRRKR